MTKFGGSFVTADGSAARCMAETVPVDVPEAAEDKATARAPGNRLIEEIVVTAQKREENLQDVPIAIQAFSADLLDAKGIDEAKDLQSVTPGLTYSQAVTFSIIYLRGIGTDAFILADPSVATYVDGIYFPFGSGQSQNFGAVERLEVLKGPQGTLFGRNTTGGAINITTKSPGDEREVSILTSYADFNTFKSRVYLASPITDTLSASISGIYDSSDEYYDFAPNSEQQKPFRDEKAYGGRAKIRWRPADWLDVVLTGLDVYQSGGGTLYQPNVTPSPLGRLLGIRPQPRNYTAEQSAPIGFTNDNKVYYGQATVFTKPLDMKLLVSDQSISNVGNLDFDGSNFPGVLVKSPLFSEVKTAEFQLLSNDTSWGADWLEWIGGAYYIESTQGLTPLLSILDSSDGDILGVPIDPLLDLIPDQIVNLFPGIPISNGINLRLTGTLDTESYAFFAQTTTKFTDWFSLTLGGRYQVERRSVAESTSGVTNLSGGQTVLFNFNRPHEETQNFSPKVTLNLRPWDQTLIYATWQEGFKGGTYNIINIYNQPEYVEPEEVTTYELGMKTDLFGGLLRLNVAAFRNEVENFQVQFISLLNGGAVSFENAEGAVIEGFDFDATALLVPSLVDDFVFTLSGAYLDGEYTKFTGGSGYVPYDTPITGGLFVTGQDFTGNQTVRTPEWTLSAALSKTFQVPGGSLETTVDAYYNSGYFYLAQNTEPFDENEYHVINGRISYLYEPSRVRLTLFGDNLNGAKYAYGTFDNDFGKSETLAPPRTVGLRLAWDWGG